jgi:hypothetical protein
MDKEKAAAALVSLSSSSSSFSSPPRRKPLGDITNRSPRTDSPNLTPPNSKLRKRAAAHYMYNELNMSLREIERSTSNSPERIPKSTAGDWVHRTSFVDEPRSGRPLAHEYEQIKTIYKDTASQRITSSILNIPRSSVQYACNQMNLRRVKRRRVPVLSARGRVTHKTDVKYWAFSDEKMFRY